MNVRRNSVADNYLAHLNETVDFLREVLGDPPGVALVLGSGLGEFLLDMRSATKVPYKEIPHFPEPRVAGHPGTLSLVRETRADFCALLGRVHLYEGLSATEVAFAVRAIALWGVKRFIITNAAGAINERFQPGDLMLIQDHLNLQGTNPLCGPHRPSLGERFPDMSEAYDPQLREQARECARSLAVGLKEGVYAALLGPNYETPAEIRMCKMIGADAVGMSTVPEVLALNQLGRRTLGISCLTNMAAGIGEGKLRHEEVLKIVRKTGQQFSSLILAIARRIGHHE